MPLPCSEKRLAAYRSYHESPFITIRAERGGQRNRGILTEDMKTQLDAVFSKMDQPLLLKLYLDERPISKELEQYARALSALTDKLSCEIDAPTLG